MAERLTTNQEVPGSTPGWIESFSFCPRYHLQDAPLHASDGHHKTTPHVPLLFLSCSVRGLLRCTNRRSSRRIP